MHSQAPSRCGRALRSSVELRYSIVRFGSVLVKYGTLMWSVGKAGLGYAVYGDGMVESRAVM